jgi:hypothetical protein
MMVTAGGVTPLFYRSGQAVKLGRTLSWLKVKQREYRELERGFYR